MLKALQRFLLMLLLLMGGLFLLYQGFLYLSVRHNMPSGMVIAGVDVGKLSAEETAVALEKRYYTPLRLTYRQETVELDPRLVGFTLDLETMMAEAQSYIEAQDPWQGYLRFLLGQSIMEPITIELRASHDPEAIRERLHTLAAFMDQPAIPPRINETTEAFEMGRSGYHTNVEASIPLIEAALYHSDRPPVTLVVEDQPAPEFDISFLEASLRKQLDAFSGVGSIFVMDLETGEEISINGDMAISGLSILKIAIFLETYRALNGPPDEFIGQLLYETAVQSSNYGANLLLEFIAGERNTYQGAAVFTEAMRRLGLVNTFMAIPYDAPTVSTRPSTFSTPANSRSDLLFVPDPARQTTAEEIGTLLAMIYYCSQGGGALLAIYPDQLTPDECQAIIDLMILNEEGNLIRFGVPNDVPVSHKHGWDGATHGDAGIVLSPGRHYVIVEYLHQPDQWLVSDISFPILREISRTIYNYFNYEDPYLGDALFEAERFDPDDPFFNPRNEDEAEGNAEDEGDLGDDPAIEEEVQGEETPQPPPPTNDGLEVQYQFETTNKASRTILRNENVITYGTEIGDWR
jgi:beta-lactamase class A